MRPFRFLVFTSADDFFLERARHTLEDEFKRAFPQGEILVFDPAPPFASFLEELQTASLFSQERLILVPAGEPLLAVEELQAQKLSSPPRLGRGEALWVGIFAQQPEPPSGSFPKAVSSWAELTHISLPPPPKPWEDVRLSREQRELLLGLLLQEVPELQGHQDVVDVLLETHGFAPRLLVQAARGLVASESLTPEAARRSMSQDTAPASSLERALQEANWSAVVEVLARLMGGAGFEGFRGELSFGRRAANGVVSLLARTCLMAMGVRLVAERAGLASELVPSRVAQPWWYPRQFKPRILPTLLKAAEAVPELQLAERSPWALQASFRVAAQFPAERLAAALVALLRFDGFRGGGEDPWSPVTLAYASLFASSKSW